MKVSRKIIVGLGLTAVVTLAVSSYGFYRISKSRNISPSADAIGSNNIIKGGCPGKASKVIRVHIEQIIPNLTNANIRCKKCVATIPPNGNGSDDDGIDGDEIDSAVPSSGDYNKEKNQEDVNTNLDINLDGSLYAGSNNVIIKLIIDSSNIASGDSIEFVHPLNDETDSSFAVRAGNNNPGMFCGREDIQANGNKTIVKFRVKYLEVKDSSGADIPSWGGLNIGVIIKKNNGLYVMPIYIDPKVYNNG